ncbi:DNA recombination protein RmuC [Citrobacter koseri]|uniref:DNA recombination protein RmuC n=1 Tax=Citrobacter koseri TaxID=545 RepID=A0A2X2WBZ2_CITKO|nr:DNA recombination protein RmuC [Citrobacter koseri]
MSAILTLKMSTRAKARCRSTSRQYVTIFACWGRKDYQQLPGLRTLDYVLMFIPVEPAFLLALDRQPELITEALKNNIMLVSPTTLLGGVAYDCQLMAL